MKTKILLAALALFFLTAPVVFAGGCDVGPILPPCVCDGNCSLGDFVYMFMRFVQYALGILSIVCVVLFIHGGFMLMISSGSSEKVATARKEISGTAIGMFLALASWVIINTIVIVLTGGSGTLFQGKPGEKPWWELQYTQPCQPNYACQVNSGTGQCYESRLCPTDQKCCLN